MNRLVVNAFVGLAFLGCHLVSHAERYALVPDQVIDENGRTWDYSRCNKGLKRFNNVSSDYIDTLDVEFRKLIAKKITTNPPRGKTVK